MKKEFARLVSESMATDKRVTVITADLGYRMWDDIRRKHNQKQFYCFGASEFSALGTTCGMALEGKIPMFYSITTFALYRTAEMIRLYMNHDKIPAKIIGAGRDFDYKKEGFTHCMPEDRQFMALFSNVKSYWPETLDELREIYPEFLYNQQPCYLNLKLIK